MKSELRRVATLTTISKNPITMKFVISMYKLREQEYYSHLLPEIDIQINIHKKLKR